MTMVVVLELLVMVEVVVVLMVRFAYVTSTTELWL